MIVGGAKFAIGSTSFCKGHGEGNKLCLHEGCTKLAKGSISYCIGHGGGNPCLHEGCIKSAQRSTNYCSAHGDGNRCLHEEKQEELTEAHQKERRKGHNAAEKEKGVVKRAEEKVTITACGGGAAKVCGKFIYLGTLLSPGTRTTEEITRRCQKARRASMGRCAQCGSGAASTTG